jgi:hypothetical protein
MYVAFFLVVGAAAYGLIQTTSAPAVSIDGPTYAEGDDVTMGDRTYTVSSTGEDSGDLTWVNESGVLTETIDNGSEVPVTDVVWEDQAARHEATFSAGDTVTDGDSEYAVAVNASAGTMTLTNVDDGSDNTTVEQGETFEFRGFEATVTDVSGDAATVVWGNSYLLVVQSEEGADPAEATFVEQRNLTGLAAADPALYDELVRQNGTLKVTYRANNTNVAVEEYFGDVERHTVAEGETLQYRGNETTIDQVDSSGLTLTRPGETTTTVTLAEGENVTVGGEEYFAHFPDNESVQILSTEDRYGEYHAQNRRIADYHDRVIGLWGVAELSAIAVIMLLAAALLPVKG